MAFFPVQDRAGVHANEARCFFLTKLELETAALEVLA